MHNIPQHPQTLITHQLECICCRHIFPIAEGPSSGSRRHGNTTALTHHHPDTHRHIYYVESGPSGPFHDMYVDQLQPGHGAHPESQEETHLFCPRCGADNRNWVHLTRNAQRDIIKQTKYFQLAGLVLLLVMILLVYLVLDPAPERRVRTGIFLISIILVAVLPLFLVPQKWRAVREHRYFIRCVPSVSLFDRVSPAIRTAVSIALFLVLGIPLLLYLILPIAAQTGKTILILDPRGDAILQIDKLSQQLPNYIVAHPEDISAIVGALQSVDAQLALPLTIAVPPNPNQLPAQTSAWTLDVLNKARMRVYELSETELVELNGRLEPAYNLVMGIDTSSTFENVNFLFTWFKFVGLTSFLASIFAVNAAKHLDKVHDSHLPRPIYHNTSDMTRVARWEMNHALRTKELVQRVQWTQVERNTNGGLSMIGFFRDRPTKLDAETVRAQEYKIETDRWCRITSAQITDLKTPPPPIGNSDGWVRDVQRVGRNTPQGGGNMSLGDGNGNGNDQNPPQLPPNTTSKIYISLPSSRT